MDWKDLQKARKYGTHLDDVRLVQMKIIEAAFGKNPPDKAYVAAHTAIAMADSFEEAVDKAKELGDAMS